MAGFIFSISKDEGMKAVYDCVQKGCYAALVPKTIDSLKAKQVVVGVLADYCSMKEGDNVYFLTERCIYGVGTLVNVGGDCKYKNYKRAHILETIKKYNAEDKPLIKYGTNARWICFFEPEERFFDKGIDMDEVLTYKPNSFRMLRAFQDRSFIKIDDEENQALKECLYLKNIENKTEMKFSKKEHTRIAALELDDYRINMQEVVLNETNTKSGEVNLEMILEAYLVDVIQNQQVGEKYDYVSHQVIASPFKPIAYIDKIDVFAYRYLDYFPNETKPIEKYLILELKKGKANVDSLLQVMKYVDWVCHEYASGNYSLIKAAVIAKDYISKGLNKAYMRECVRSYISSTHPNVSSTWQDIDLFTYNVNTETGEMKFTKYDTFDSYEYFYENIDRLGLVITKNDIVVSGEKVKIKCKLKNKRIAIVGGNDGDAISRLEGAGWKVLVLKKTDGKSEVDEIISEIIK